MKTIWNDTKWFLLAAFGFSGLALVLAFGNGGSVWVTACIVSFGQGIGILGFVFLKNKTLFSKDNLKYLYETQKNKNARTWRDRNLIFHVFAGRLGLICVVLSTMWIDAAVAAPVFSANVVFFMFLRYIDGKTPQTTMKLGWIGWLVAAASAVGVTMTAFSENGIVEIVGLANWGILLLVVGVLLDAYNVERSMKLIEISKTKDSLSFGMIVVGGLHMLIGLSILPFAIAQGSDMTLPQLAVSFIISLTFFSAAAISSRQGNATTTRLESNIVVQGAEILGLLWLWLVSLTSWTEFDINRKDWLLMGVILIMLSGALSQLNISLKQRSS